MCVCVCVYVERGLCSSHPLTLATAQERCTVVSLDAGTDYRMLHAQAQPWRCVSKVERSIAHASHGGA